MPESQSGINKFEVRNVKVEVIEVKKEIYNRLLENAHTVRKLGYFAVSYPIIMATLWSTEISELGSIEKYAAGGGAVFTSIAAAVISERTRRLYISEAIAEAQDVVDLSQEEPAVPTPNWAKKATGDSV